MKLFHKIIAKFSVLSFIDPADIKPPVFPFIH